LCILVVLVPIFMLSVKYKMKSPKHRVMCYGTFCFPCTSIIMPSKGKIRSQLLDRYLTFNERFLHYLHHESIPFWAAPQPDYIFTSIFHAPFFHFVSNGCIKYEPNYFVTQTCCSALSSCLLSTPTRPQYDIYRHHLWIIRFGKVDGYL
jgi:hypothetical protein